MAGPERQVLAAQHLRAGNGDCSCLEHAEEQADASRRLPDEDEHPVTPADPALAQEAGPARGALGQLGERELSPLACRGDERQPDPAAVGGEHLDHVAREVEAVGDLPAVADDRRPELGHDPAIVDPSPKKVRRPDVEPPPGRDVGCGPTFTATPRSKDRPSTAQMHDPKG